MKFDQFLETIQQLKTTSLGGLDAHFKLAPKLRMKYDKDKISASNPKRAAVLAFFYPNENNDTCFLLTKRATYKGTHSAQVSFPGGKIEKSDTNLEETALRESFEEVGIHQNSVKIIRELTDVYIPPSNFLATPFMGYAERRPDFKINTEVQITIEVLVTDLLNDKSIASTRISNTYMKNTSVPCFKLSNHIVWGATAMMLSEIKELLISHSS
jgi:8-oxo-dGTP pyrophosphatase MutT (NUDIX family)